jgi:predicted membrane-bound spermidine synthase
VTGRPVVRVLMTLALLSGCCGLAYEVLYIRALTTLLGDTLYVHAALLSTFLVGIGLGARLAHRCRAWLWAFEILTGLYAFALPTVTAWLPERTATIQITASPTLTILTTIAFLSLPSLLIGFSIPLFSAYIKSQSRERLAFRGVYLAYNVGALLSVLAVEFILVRQFGVSRSLALVGAINVFNGVVLWALRHTEVVDPPAPARRFPRRIAIALALAGIASAVFQVFFLRLCYLVFGPHRENFSISLSIALLGIAIGAALAARTRIRFATLLVLAPLAMSAIFAAYRPILDLHDRLAPLARSSEASFVGAEFLIGCMFALVPMVLFGATLPALMRTEQEVADESGYLLWITSLANAAGYLAYVLVGHPFLSGSVVIGLLCLMSFAGSLLAADFRWSTLQRGLAVAGLVTLVVFFARWDDREFYLAQWRDEIVPSDDVRVFKSGAESATLVRTPDYEWVSYNGHPSVVVRKVNALQSPELLSGVVPALGAPRLERALVLGLGTGATAGATARIFAHTDVAEINQAFIDMLPELDYFNLDIENNPSASVHLADGRSFLAGHDGTYDAIVNSIPAPTYYSASKIYTVEFYDRVRTALKPDGVFCTWLAVHELSERGIATVLAALGRSFESCDLHLLTGGYYMATCSNAPREPRRFSELPAQPVLTDALAEALPGFDLDTFFEDVYLSDNILANGIPAVDRHNTDDLPILEFLVVRSGRLKHRGLDPFLAYGERFNIDAVGTARTDRDALVRRAMTFRRLNSAIYELVFEPLLEASIDAESD